MKEMQALCINVEVLADDGSEIEMRELDEDVFRTAEELGIDICRPERGSDDDDADRPAPVRVLVDGSLARLPSACLARPRPGGRSDLHDLHDTNDDDTTRDAK